MLTFFGVLKIFMFLNSSCVLEIHTGVFMDEIMGYLVFALKHSRQGEVCRVGRSVLIKPNWLYIYSCWMRVYDGLLY